MRIRTNIRWLATALCLLLLTLGLPAPAAHAVASCGNPIACENQLPGTPQSVWDDGTDDQTILGYATQTSVNVGSPIDFKVNTDAHAYTIDIYRLGYYQGNGARKITSVPVTAVDGTCQVAETAQAPQSKRSVAVSRRQAGWLWGRVAVTGTDVIFRAPLPW